MKKNVLYVVLFSAVLGYGVSVSAVAQHKDKILSNAEQLLKGYTPPTINTWQATESPKESWQKIYDKQVSSVTIRYAFSVLGYSTQYNATNFSPYQALGAPNVYPSNGVGGAWAAATADGQREYLEVGYLNPAPISAVLIYETYGPGSVDTVYAKNPNTDMWEVLWSGTAIAAGPPNSARIFEVDFPTTPYAVSQIRIAINSPAVTNWNEIDAIAIASGPVLPALRVNTMPSNHTSTTYANAVVGSSINVWGNASGGVSPYKYWLDYGDGTIDSGSVSNGHYIGNTHTYSGAGLKTMKLLVQDNFGRSDSDQSSIRVYPAATQQINVNMAIEKGLLFAYNSQYSDGSWRDCSEWSGTTGAALLAMEENGHLATNDIDDDIYAEYVKLGLNYLFSIVGQYGIFPQCAGHRDALSNGLGAYFSGNTYANGLACLAVLGAHQSGESAQLDTIKVGAYNGLSYYDIMQDCIDQICFSQTDCGSGVQRGGWRYCINCENYGSSDNSATQWPSLVLEASQNSWGIAIPQYVKNELLLWLQYSQNADGGFGYTDPSWRNIAKTGSAIASYAFLDSSSSIYPVQNAIHFMDSIWSNTSDNNGYAEMLNGNLYAMYALTKGMRLLDNRIGVVYVGAHDWYLEYVNHLLSNATWRQNSNGSWPSNVWVCSGTSLSASFGVLILTQGVVIAPPVAVIAPVSPLPPNWSFQINGSGSYHQDPSRFIVEWKWDWNAADGINWDSADAFGPSPTNPGYTDTGTYTITLRVRDNSVPSRYATTTTSVRVDTENHPPVAIPIPPNRGLSYAAHVDEPILLDAHASFDPDTQDSVVAYSWDLDGNGTFGDATTDTITQTFSNEYQGQVGLRVYDSHGDSSTSTAYINIAASRKDIYPVRLIPTPYTVTRNGTVNILAVFKNDDLSNVNVPSALVRIYDGDPLTTGSRFGDDYYVALPIGQPETLKTSIKIPADMPNGTHKLYLWLDANQQIAEWNEINNFDSAYITVVDSVSSNMYRTATMSEWASATDQKGAFKAVKCKPDKVDFKFALMDTVPGSGTSLSLDFGMIVHAAVTNAVTGDTFQVVNGKKAFMTFFPQLDSGAVVLVEGRGGKGKKIAVKYYFGSTKKATLADSLYERNSLLLPLPNWHNVGGTMPTGAFPMYVGVATDPHSVKIDKYATALKSLNKKGALHTGPPHCLDKLDNGTLIKKQLKGLPPDKMNNSLFAEQLVLKLNVAASDYGILPTGLGNLIYDARNIDVTDPFNGDSVRTVISYVDQYLSCLSTPRGTDSTRYFNVVHNINAAFSDSMFDTLSWSCSNLVLTGVKTVQDVAYMSGTPGAIPALSFQFTPSEIDQPSAFRLHQNYPNPFNPTTIIQFDLPEAGLVTLKVYNVLGQEVATLLNHESMDFGTQEIQFNAQQLPSGVYFYRISVQTLGNEEEGTAATSYLSVKKMLLLK